jgi:polysaccharide export outer membrane protein
VAVLGLAALFVAPAAQAQLEEFGVPNTNNSGVMQQQQAEALKPDQQDTGQCADSDSTNCGAAGGAAGVPIGGGSANSNFQFQQPLQNTGNGRNERYQPQYTFEPEAPTQFQRYVGASTGVWLPIFGSNLFNGVPSTFAPVNNVPVPRDYVIGPGDEILLQAYGQINFDLRLTVDRSGQIQVPKVGTVRVAGLKFSQLQPFLTQQVGRYFRNFSLNVNMGQLRTVQVFVTGAARRPGSFILSSLSTLVNAVFAVGGPAADGSMRKIELRRDGQVVTTLDMYDLLLRGRKDGDARLLPGDILYFPPAGPRVAVYGAVDRPAIYELKGPATLGAVLDLAGGASAVAQLQHAELQRIVDHKLRHVLDVSLDAEGRNAVIADGDVLRVFSQSPRFDNAVVLRGNVANPGTYAWHDGMKLRDLIPDTESLITREYWRQRAKLGLSVLDYAPVPVSNPSADTQPVFQQQVIGGNELTAQTGQRAAQAQGYAQPGTLGRVQPNAANESTVGGSTIQPLENSIGHATAAGGAPALAQRFPPKNNVELPVPDIDWSYAVIERTNKETLKTELVPFHLGELIAGDESQNLALLPGDVVTIFSQADFHIPRQEQTRLVYIEGEIAHAGVYSVQPGETLRDVVARAGGLTAGAYLYGASFTRESVRQQQQQRLDEYINQLAEERQHAALQLAADASASGGGASAAAGADSLQILRSLRASGRIVLNMRPDDHDLAAIPDFPLEGGDHLLVPALPSSVTVIGSVYNQNSFLFEQGRRAGDYLREAGGANRLADGRHEFIVRADGAVVGRTFSDGKLASGFGSERMSPGDTIIVPEKLINPSVLRSFLQYSTAFSSLALTAATVALLR